MCVSQFQAYANASQWRRDGGDYSFTEDIEDSTLEIRNDAIKHREAIDGNTEIHYLVTDLKEMKRLAKINNPYAIKHLEKKVEIY
jgi:hypothetical protein